MEAGSQAMEMKLVLELMGKTLPVTVHGEDGPLEVEMDGRTFHIDARRNPITGGLSLLVDGRSVEGWADPVPEGGYRVTLLGRSIEVGAEDALRASLGKIKGKGGGRELIKAPMPGVVVEVKAAEGDIVEAGQPVVIVEAMKMFNEFGPRHRGKVAKIMVSPGQNVDKGQELALIEPPPGE